MKIKEIIFCMIYVILALFGMTFIKLGNQNGQKVMHLLGIPVTLNLIIGVFLYGLSFLLYTGIISKMQISLALPFVSAINSVAIVIIGMIVFKERLLWGQMLGILVVIIGVFIIGIFSK